MMNCKKVVIDGHILGIGKTTGSGNISDADYARLTEVLKNKPEAPEGYIYLLHDEDETWELIAVDPPDPDPDVDDAEAFQYLFGGEA